MPKKSKASRVASAREEQRREVRQHQEGTFDASVHRYKPHDPAYVPYWDAFYTNPYPNPTECKEITKKLGTDAQVVQKWFKMARVFTHMPEKEPDVEDEGSLGKSGEDESAECQNDFEDTSDDEEAVLGTLYAHFYQIKRPDGPTLSSKRHKRKRASTQSEILPVPKASRLGPRGPYKKASRTTHWRNRKHAGDIRQFFTSNATKTGSEKQVSQDICVVSDDDSIEIECERTSQAASGASSLRALCEEDQDTVLMPRAKQSEGLGIGDANSIAVPHPSASATPLSEERVAIQEYQAALELLEQSMDRLKIDLSGRDPSVVPEICGSPGLDPGFTEEGPTLQDAVDEEEDMTQVLDVEGRTDGSRFYTTLSQHLTRLLEEAKKAKVPSIKTILELTVISDYNIRRECLRKDGCRSPSITASNEIAQVRCFDPFKGEVKTKKEQLSRRIRTKAMHIINFGCLPGLNQGKGATHHTLLCHDDVRQGIAAYLRSQKVGQIIPTLLRREVNQSILPALGILSPISQSTAERWLKKLGYHQSEHRKGVYMDGHERSDVIAYRKEFLKTMNQLQPLIQQYDDVTGEPLLLNLPPGEQVHVPVSHDECSFHANDRQTSVWLKDDEQQLRQKSRGRLIHVSSFSVEKFGQLALSEEDVEKNKSLPPGQQLSVTNARKIIEPGKNHDKWWDMDQLCNQASLVDAIKIFDYLYPGCIGVFLFDQSSAHNAFADDALVAKRMNVNSGGKVKLMHSTKIPMDNPNPLLRGRDQSMVFPPGHKLAGQAKGMKVVLEERGLIGFIDKNKSGNVVGVCKECKQSEAAQTKAEKEARERMAEDPEFYGSLEDAGYEELVLNTMARSTCCMQRYLSLQQDFLDEKPRIQIMIEQAGHKCIFLPKFHCELNPIEMHWGYAKNRFREQCDGTLRTARRLVPECLDACSVLTIRRFWRKTWRYMDAYSKGLTGKQAEFAVKKYKSHRRVGKLVMEDIGPLVSTQ